MPLRESKIGYDGTHFGWNPGGAACSNKCPGCWSLAKVGPRMKCQECQDNIVHLHKERLGDLAKRNKPATVLVNFTCDTFDLHRPSSDLRAILRAAKAADWHTYVFLTKQPHFMLQELGLWGLAGTVPVQDNWYLGLSIRNQADADAKLPAFLQIPGKLWISYEPAWGAVDWGHIPYGKKEPLTINGHEVTYQSQISALRRPRVLKPGETLLVPPKVRGVEGIIVGHDNQRVRNGLAVLGTRSLGHIRSTVAECRAAGVKVYVKQLWIDGKLRTDPKDFPEDLRIRDLPWGEKEQGNG